MARQNDLIALLAGFAASALLTWLVLRHALARGIMDVPNKRSSHTVAVPRGGGAAIVITCICTVTVLLGRLDLQLALALLSGGALVAVVGYLDDVRGLVATKRFTAHIIAACIAVAAVWSEIPGLAGPAVTLLISVLWVVGIAWSINLFNFMDGIDALAGSQATFVAGATAFLLFLFHPDAPLATLALATAGACLGFLAWNWPPARIFMGDVGSGFLGFWLAFLALALHAYGQLSVWTSLVLNSVFIADASVTLAQRVARGARWYEAHRSHAYQHLSRRWRSHAKVTGLVWLVNLSVVLPLALATLRKPELGPAIAAGTLTVVAIAVAVVGAGHADE